MTTAAITILEALQDHLEDITTENGYAVTVASVVLGRSALAISRAGDFPVISLTSTKDEPEQTTLQPGQFYQTWNRTVMLEAMTTESASGWDVDLDTLWDAIRTSLARYPGIIFWSGVEFFPPGDNGTLCLLRLPLTFSYSILITE